MIVIFHPSYTIVGDQILTNITLKTDSLTVIENLTGMAEAKTETANTETPLPLSNDNKNVLFAANLNAHLTALHSHCTRRSCSREQRPAFDIYARCTTNGVPSYPESAAGGPEQFWCSTLDHSG